MLNFFRRRAAAPQPAKQPAPPLTSRQLVAEGLKSKTLTRDELQALLDGAAARLERQHLERLPQRDRGYEKGPCGAYCTHPDYPSVTGKTHGCGKADCVSPLPQPESYPQLVVDNAPKPKIGADHPLLPEHLLEKPRRAAQG